MLSLSDPKWQAIGIRTKAEVNMFKIIATAILLGGLSTMIVIPTLERSSPSRPAFATDRLVSQTQSGARNYQAPHLHGEPVAFCLLGGSQCGKEAADAFCRGNGFAEALTFRRDSIQPDPAKLHFRQIKCSRPKVTVDTD
jgi:hypothetical protein